MMYGKGSLTGKAVNTIKYSGTNEREQIDNFDEKNISVIRSALESEKDGEPCVKKAFIMQQNSKSCEVEVNENSRKKCANAIVK